MHRAFFAVSRTFFLPLLAVLVCFASGCDLTSAEDARLQIQITDAPSDYIEKAEVWISRVYVKCEDFDDDDDHEHLYHSAAFEPAAAAQGNDDDDDELEEEEDDDEDEECERVDLFNDPADPFHVDLLALRDGLVNNLTVPVDLPEGTYEKLYVVVDSAFVTLKAPHSFPDGSRTMALRIAGGSRRAIKVELDEPLVVASGALTLVLVDFDVNESFVILGSHHGASGIKGVLLIPKLKERHRSEHHD